MIFTAVQYYSPATDWFSFNYNQLVGVVNFTIDELTERTVNQFFKEIPIFLIVIASCCEKLAIKVLKKGADPNAKSQSISALHLAAAKGYYDLVDLLLEKGADPNALDFSKNNYLYSLQSGLVPSRYKHPFLLKCLQEERLTDLYDYHKEFVSVTPLREYFELHPVNEQTHKEWKTIYATRLCAHLFDIGGHIQLTEKSQREKKVLIQLEGLISACKIMLKITRWLEKHKESLDIPIEIIEKIIAFSKLAANPEVPTADYLQRIQSGEPTLIISASYQHSWVVLFFGDFFALCNFVGEIDFYPYDPSSLQEDVLQALLDASALDSEGETRSKVEKLKKCTISSDTSVHLEYRKRLVWNSETATGNCVWKSVEAALTVCFAVYGFQKNVPDEEIKRWNENFFIDFKIYSASRYLSTIQNKESPYKPNLIFIENLVQVIESQKDSSERVKNFLEKARLFIEENQIEDIGSRSDSSFEEKSLNPIFKVEKEPKDYGEGYRHLIKFSKIPTITFLEPDDQSGE